MIQFPETAAREWQVVHEASTAKHEVQQRIERGANVERALERMRVNHEAKTLLQQELDADLTPPLIMGTIADFVTMGQSTPNDLIEGVAKEGFTGILGPSEAGKTTLALQMLHCLIDGTDFLGQTVKPISGNVGILSYDQNAKLMTNWIVASKTDISRVSMVDLYGRGNPLNVPAMRQQIVSAWRAMDVEIVLIDSFSAAFVGHDQNDTAQTMAWYQDIKRFVISEVGAKSGLVILHSTDSNPLKPRGSTAHKDALDSLISITLTDVTDRSSPRKVAMQKYREALGQAEMEPVIITAPDNVTHLVDLDFGAMSLAGMRIPPSAGAAAFAPPTPHEAPETDEEEDDL